MIKPGSAHGRNHIQLQHPAGSNWARFCPRCGCRLEDTYIESEQHVRKLCSGCGFIFYINPKVVAAAIPRQDGRIWLLRRNIEPALGKWTFPGGYVDMGESVAQAAIRETREETLLETRLDSLLNVYSYADSGIVVIVYRSTVIGGNPGLSPESREIRAFDARDIPWMRLAFPSTREALADYVKLEKTGAARK